ncbi:MAG: GTP 3',8-cyclase MoaA, partial [Deferribacterota bacterium]|nr:GTP 3',8-cyclase MoaA [Deferribacterota bacterium]
RILENIELANKLGFKPIKINTVLLKGFNDGEILDFCEFAAKTNTFVRFIEFMPVGDNKWNEDKIIKKEDVLKIISSKYSFKKIEDHYNTTSTDYQLSNGGIIGLITPITNHFCKYCNKIRILANGNIRPCLLSNNEISLFDIIKKRDSKNFLKTVQKAIDMKPKNHNIINDKGGGNDTPMSSIGG